MTQKLRGRRAILPALVLAAFALLAAAIAGAFHHDSALATHLPIAEVAIDMDVAGNGDNSLGPTESCNRSSLAVGDEFDIDVVVRGVPPFDPGSSTDGIISYSFNLLFDPAVVQVDNVQALDGPTILKADGPPDPFVVIDYDVWSGTNRDPAPGRTGNVRIDVVDLSQKFEQGDGVLTRITLRAAGDGASLLMARNTTWPEKGPQPWILDAAANLYDISKTTDGVVHVGSGDCQAVPPTPVPTPVLTPGPTMPPAPSPAPKPVPTAVPTLPIVGDAELRIGGASVHEGETFEVNLEASVDPPGVGDYSVQVHYPQSLLTALRCRVLAGTLCGTWHGKVGDDAVWFERQVFPEWEGLTGQLQLGTIQFRVGDLNGGPESTALLSVSTLKFEAPISYSGRFDLKTVNGEVNISPAPTPSPVYAGPNPLPAPGATAASSPAALPRAGSGEVTGSGLTLGLAVAILSAGLALTAGGPVTLLLWRRGRRTPRRP